MGCIATMVPEPGFVNLDHLLGEKSWMAMPSCGGGEKPLSFDPAFGTLIGPRGETVFCCWPLAQTGPAYEDNKTARQPEKVYDP